MRRSLASALVLFATACGGLPEDVDATDQALTTTSVGWTSWFSEESPNNYGMANANSLPTGVRCRGSYCDDMTLQFKAEYDAGWSTEWTPGAAQSTYWSYGAFAQRTMRRRCNLETEYVVGLRCEGSNCSDLKIQCRVPHSSKAPEFRTCVTTAWVSEENGGQLLFPPGMYPIEVECGGSRCDNVRFLVCDL